MSPTSYQAAPSRVKGVDYSTDYGACSFALAIWTYISTSGEHFLAGRVAAGALHNDNFTIFFGKFSDVGVGQYFQHPL